MLDKLKDLCLLDGISGDEGAVREYIIDKIGDKAEIRVDNLGNVIAFCKGKKTPKNKIMVSAHMDEVGMIVTYVNSDGTLKVSESDDTKHIIRDIIDEANLKDMVKEGKAAFKQAKADGSFNKAQKAKCCPKCKAEVKEGQKFCSECGNEL